MIFEGLGKLFLRKLIIIFLDCDEYSYYWLLIIVFWNIIDFDNLVVFGLNFLVMLINGFSEV